MKTAAVIAEYNPFHNGHAWQLEQIRAESGADFLVVLMSGPFVQRGEPAILDQYRRTKCALLCGADLVVQMPAAVSAGSAREFAEGSAAILDRMGIIDELWFGTESGEPELLQKIAAVLTDEPESFREGLRTALASGLPYPAAQEAGLKQALGETDLHSFLSGSNHILGMEYLRALRLRNSRIIPHVLPRIGTGHKENGMLQKDGKIYASADQIRRYLDEGNMDAAASAVPDAAEEILRTAKNELVFPDDFTDMLALRLREMSEAEIADCAGVGRELARRILRFRNTAGTVTELEESVKAKNFTRTRVNRALMHILLRIPEGGSREAAAGGAIRILGLRKEASVLFGRIRKQGSVRTSADAAGLASESFRTDLLAERLYEWTASRKGGRTAIEPEQRRLITI